MPGTWSPPIAAMLECRFHLCLSHCWSDAGGGSDLECGRRGLLFLALGRLRDSHDTDAIPSAHLWSATRRPRLRLRKPRRRWFGGIETIAASGKLFPASAAPDPTGRFLPARSSFATVPVEVGNAFFQQVPVASELCQQPATGVVANVLGPNLVPVFQSAYTELLPQPADVPLTVLPASPKPHRYSGKPPLAPGPRRIEVFHGSDNRCAVAL